MALGQWAIGTQMIGGSQPVSVLDLGTATHAILDTDGRTSVVIDGAPPNANMVVLDNDGSSDVVLT